MGKVFRKYSLVTIGSFLLAFGVSEFLVPNRLAIGGVSGVSTILHHLFGWNMSLLIIIINIPIFIIGMISEGKGFLYRSIYGTIMLSVFLEILAFMRVPQYDFFISAVFGGALSGAGIGIALIGGGTTGGTDIISKVLNRKFPHISIGFWVLAVDALIIGSAMLLFHDLNVGLYSAVGLMVSSITVDYCLQGINFTKTVFIITNRAKEISKDIHEKLRRGATEFEARGTYTSEGKTIILCTVNKWEVSQMIRLIKEIDKSAFIITSDSREIYGKGFLN